MPSPLTILLLSLVLTCWLGAALHALQELSWGRIKKLDETKRADLITQAERLMAARDSYLLLLRLLQLANLVMLALVAYDFSAGWLQRQAAAPVLVAILAVVAVHLVCAELIGQALLGRHLWLVVGWSSPLLRVLHLVASPLIVPLLRFQERLHARALPKDEEEIVTTADEIISLVDQDEHEQPAESDLEDSERQMIRGIFDLDETLVREIMTPRVDILALPLTASLSEACQFVVEHGHSRIPIYSESVDHIVGILHAKDLLDERRTRQAKDLQPFLQSPLFVPETKNIGDLLDEFKQGKKQLAIIIDEYGGTAGLVTIEDILEEIVGEIRDEYDTHEVDQPFTVEPDGRIVADARTPIDVINDLLATHLPEDEDFDTVGGYITSSLGRIPRAAEKFEMDDLDVEILDADERKVTRLALRKRIAGELPEEAGR